MRAYGIFDFASVSATPFCHWPWDLPDEANIPPGTYFNLHPSIHALQAPIWTYRTTLHRQ